MNQKLSNKTYELIKVGLEKTQKNGDFKAKIYFAEKCEFYYYAGKISKLHGLFKRAYKNFEKIGENKELENLNEIVFPKKFLKVMEMQKNEKLLKICEEKMHYENWNKLFYNKIDENLKDYLKKIQELKYSHQRIKIYN